MPHAPCSLTRSIAVCLLLACAAPAAAQPPTFAAIGDSIAEGVQSADASSRTQPYSFANLVAWRMGASLPLPLIRSGPLGAAGNLSGRTRIDPSVRAGNLGVNGADVHSLLYDAATAVIPSQITTETGLVLFPQIGSQMDVVEQQRPQYVACWIGNNDALGAVLAFDQLDATQLTSVADFTADFTQIADRLQAIGAKTVFATIPDIASIGYLVDQQDLVRFLGQSYGLPAGSVTTLGAMVLVKLGLASTAIFSNPDYVLDPTEQQTISQRITDFNRVIVTTAASHNMGVVDAHGVFDYLAHNAVSVFGVTLTTRFLGGLFSLDGVHPSDIGHGLAAALFIDAFNRRYGANIPQLDTYSLWYLTQTDPFIDKDGDGRVTGRAGAGVLETVFSLLGISGDTNDGAVVLPKDITAASTQALAPTSPSVTTTAAQQTRALDEIAKRTGQDLRTMSRQEQVRALQRLFGTPRAAR